MRSAHTAAEQELLSVVVACWLEENPHMGLGLSSRRENLILSQILSQEGGVLAQEH